jgi:hypothetical protein
MAFPGPSGTLIAPRPPRGHSRGRTHPALKGLPFLTWWKTFIYAKIIRLYTKDFINNKGKVALCLS